MNESVFEVFRAQDLLTPGQDPILVKKYLSALESFQCIGSLDSKDINEFSAAVNVCLNSPKGHYNGLQAALVLLKHCTAEYFNQNGGRLLSVVAHQILGKPGSLTPPTASLACQVLSKVISLAPSFPDVSKQLSSMAASTVQSLIVLANKLPSSIGSVLDCLATLLITYSGSCGGAAATQVEKFVCNRIRVDSGAPSEGLAKVFAILPRLGGGGKDGVQHKDSWTKLFAKTMTTLTKLNRQIVAEIPGNSFKNDDVSTESVTSSLQIPDVGKGPGLAKIFAIEHQFRLVCRLLSGLIRGPFPQVKRFKPQLILDQLSWLFGQAQFGALARSLAHESKTLLVALPRVYKSALVLLVELVKTLELDALPLQNNLHRIVVRILQDLRQVAGVEKQEFQVKSFSAVKICLFALVRQMNEVSGSSFSVSKQADELVTLIVADFLPANESVQLVAAAAGGGTTSRKRKKGPKTVSFLGNSFTNAVNKLSMGSGSSGSSLAAASLDTLASLFRTSGPYLSMGVHKNVQCAVLAACFTVQTAAAGAPPAPFDEPSARAALYNALSSLLSGCHAKYPHPLSYAKRIFLAGKLHDPSHTVRQVCAGNLNLSDSLTHPQAASLGLETALSEAEMAAVAKDMMKVHTITLSTVSANGGAGTFVTTSGHDNDQAKSRNGKEGDDPMDKDAPNDKQIDDDDKSAAEKASAQSGGGNYSDDPNYKLLAGKSKDASSDSIKKAISSEKNPAANSAADADEVSYEESKEILKAYHNFSNDPIVIPEDAVKNGTGSRKNPDDTDSKPAGKRAKMSTVENGEKKPDDADEEDQIDVTEMLSSFVDKLRDDDDE